MKIIKIQDLIDIEEYRKPMTARLQDLVGKPIAILGFDAKQSQKYGKQGYVMHILMEKRKMDVFTCAVNIVAQLNQIKVKMAETGTTGVPIACKVAQIDKSFYLDSF